MSEELFKFIIFRFEGGCKYPYLSEVARSGLGWLSFFLGTGVGWIPWIIFAFDYYRVFSLFGMTVTDPRKKRRYMFSQKVAKSKALRTVDAAGFLYNSGDWYARSCVF